MVGLRPLSERRPLSHTFFRLQQTGVPRWSSKITPWIDSYSPSEPLARLSSARDSDSKPQRPDPCMFAIIVGTSASSGATAAALSSSVTELGPTGVHYFLSLAGGTAVKARMGI